MIGKNCCKAVPVCFLENPDLYVRVVHGMNSHPEEYFARNVFKDHTGLLNEDMVTTTMRNLR